MERGATAVFADEISRCRDMVGLARSIGSMTRDSIDLSDVLRAALAFGVGALDNFVHAVLVESFVEVLTGARAPVRDGRAHAIPLWMLVDFADAEDRSVASLDAGAHIRQSLRRATFQQPDDIADALKMIRGDSFWLSAYGDPQSAGRAREQLKLIVMRRNAIVHEADVDPSTGEKWPIDPVLVGQAIDHIEAVVSKVEAHVGLTSTSGRGADGT